MTLTWNLVTKHLHPHDQLQQKLREKISKLERHLQHFPPDAVHLQVQLERLAKRTLFDAALTLRLPSNILRSTKRAVDPIPAFDHAMKALLRELATLKSQLRREQTWRRKERRAQLRETKPVRFARQPLAPGQGPQSLADVISGLLQDQYDRLLEHVRRRLEHDAAAGMIPRGALDARSVVDEVARLALSQPNAKPSATSFRLWLFALVRRELRRRYAQLRRQATEDVSVEQLRVVDGDDERAAPSDGQGTQESVERNFEPATVEAGELMADASALAPDEDLAHRDFIDYLHRSASAWPKLERDVFELHFMEGFEPEEIALIEGQKTADIRALIPRVQQRVRQMMATAAGEMTRRPRAAPAALRR